jgi:hypothetical protein
MNPLSDLPPAVPLREAYLSHPCSTQYMYVCMYVYIYIVNRNMFVPKASCLTKGRYGTCMHVYVCVYVCVCTCIYVNTSDKSA